MKQTTPEPSPPVSTIPPPKKKRGGCRRLLRGCFIFLLILLILAGILSFFFFRVPEKLGFAPSRAEKLLVSTPNRAAGQAILQEASAAGLPTTGMRLYVMPMQEGNETIAFAVFDAREGFAFHRTEGDPIIRTLVTLGTTPSIRANHISVLGFEFYDEKGRSYMTIAARIDDIEKVANGQMSEQDFMKVSYGDIRFDQIFSNEMDNLKELLSESEPSP